VSGKPEFLYSAAVLATESLKALLSVLWVLSHGGSLQGIVAFLLDEWRIFVRVLVPAGVYNCQQMLEFVALSRLDAPVYSVLVQSKLLTTALFSYFLLRKQLARKQVHEGCDAFSCPSSRSCQLPGRARRLLPPPNFCTHAALSCPQRQPRTLPSAAASAATRRNP